MKTKFNPKEVPHWVRWIAVDRSGICMGFISKPIPLLGRFDSLWAFGKGKSCSVFLYVGKPPKDWESEIYTWK